MIMTKKTKKNVNMIKNFKDFINESKKQTKSVKYSITDEKVIKFVKIMVDLEGLEEFDKFIEGSIKLDIFADWIASFEGEPDDDDTPEKLRLNRMIKATEELAIYLYKSEQISKKEYDKLMDAAHELTYTHDL